MAVEQSIDTDKVLKKINKTIKEIKKGIVLQVLMLHQQRLSMKLLHIALKQ